MGTLSLQTSFWLKCGKIYLENDLIGKALHLGKSNAYKIKIWNMEKIQLEVCKLALQLYSCMIVLHSGKSNAYKIKIWNMETKSIRSLQTTIVWYVNKGSHLQSSSWVNVCNEPTCLCYIPCLRKQIVPIYNIISFNLLSIDWTLCGDVSACFCVNWCINHAHLDWNYIFMWENTCARARGICAIFKVRISM